MSLLIYVHVFLEVWAASEEHSDIAWSKDPSIWIIILTIEFLQD